MSLKDFRDLHVYQGAFESAMEIFRLSRTWPVEERYSLTNQIRRSSRSVASNISEAWRKRRYPAAFVSKLSDSDAEAGETVTWLAFAKECGYMDAATWKRLTDRYDHFCAQLVIMMNQGSRWGLR